MINAFEHIKETEQHADSILSNARDEISVLKKELSSDIHDLESKYHTQLYDFQNELKQEQSDAIARQLSSLDETFNQQINAMEQSFLSCKKELILALIGKVIHSNGNLNC